jgi:hypothetical protein
MTVEPEGDDLAMRILAVLLVLTAIMPILYLYIRRKEASRRAEE